MKWEVMGDKMDLKVDVINYGALMNMADFSNRWTYRGSVTTPPCAEIVHWNVLSTVFPISEKHLKLFKGQLDKAK